MREHVAGHPTYHVIKRDQIKMRSIWTGGLPHLSGLPHLPGVPHQTGSKSLFYYINTNEIPGELSRENMISSHVIFRCEKITVAMAT